MVLYAPHITEISAMHPAVAQIGYHCRDYFLGQWDRFADQAWGDLAHSTHLRGEGTWSPSQGSVSGHVTLATGIPEAEVRAVGLDYLDPDAHRRGRVGGRSRHARRATGRRGPLPAPHRPGRTVRRRSGAGAHVVTARRRGRPSRDDPTTRSDDDLLDGPSWPSPTMASRARRCASSPGSSG